MRNPRRVWIPSLILVGLIITVVVLLRHYGFTHFSRDQIDRFQDIILGWGVWGYLAYIGLTLVICLAVGPVTPMVLVAGVFGVVKGTILSSLTLTLGSVCAFLLARYTFRPFLHDKFGHLPSFQKIDAGVARDGWHMLLITRLVPMIPFSLQNYLYGLTRISLGIYALITWLCVVPPCIAYVLIGSSLIQGEGHIKQILLYLLVGAVLLAALSLVPRYLARRMHVKLPEDQKEERSDVPENQLPTDDIKNAPS